MVLNLGCSNRQRILVLKLKYHYLKVQTLKGLDFLFLRMKKLFIILLLASFTGLKAQEFYRIKADVSIKDKMANGSSRLTMGKVYYDKPTQKLLYDLNFPYPEKIVIKDSLLFKINKDSISNQKVMIMNELSIFHLALSGKLADYGINSGKTKGIFKIADIKKEDDGRVITTWDVAEKRLKEYLGKIVMANADKKLDAIAFYDTKGKLVSQQFFKEYLNVKGVEFPQKVTQISYSSDGTQNLQQTTYKNIVINQADENDLYDYPMPVLK
jgi:hypothetical protein